MRRVLVGQGLLWEQDVVQALLGRWQQGLAVSAAVPFVQLVPWAVLLYDKSSSPRDPSDPS